MSVALVPSLITAALLVTLLTPRQLVNLRRMAQSNAEAVATQTASICVKPLCNMQLRELLRIADSIGDLPHVTRVQIRTSAGQILADHREPADNDSQHDILTVVHDVVDGDRPSRAVVGSVLVDVSLHDAIAAQHASQRHALFALLLSLLIAGVIGWQAARWISAPLRHLAGAMRQLGWRLRRRLAFRPRTGPGHGAATGGIAGNPGAGEIAVGSRQHLPPAVAVDRGAARTHGPDSNPTTDLADRRMLVLDDDPAIISVIRFLLRSWGCDVAVAEDRRQAQEAIEQWPRSPGIVISDLNLRGGERGIDIFAGLDAYHRRDGGKPFARLLITGETRIERLREVIAVKIPLLYKPVSPQHLHAARISALTAAVDG